MHECGLLDSEYAKYLGQVTQTLTRENFEINQNVKIGQYQVDLLCYKAVVGLKLAYRAICQIMYDDDVTVDMIRGYSNTMYEFGTKYKPFAYSTCLVFPVMVSRKIDVDTKSFVQAFNGRHFVLGAFQIEHPVLLELSTVRVFHRDKAGFVGSLPQKVAADFANKHFTLD